MCALYMHTQTTSFKILESPGRISGCRKSVMSFLFYFIKIVNWLRLIVILGYFYFSDGKDCDYISFLFL